MLYSWAGRSLLYFQIGAVMFDPYNSSSPNYWAGLTILCIFALTLAASPFIDAPFPSDKTPTASDLPEAPIPLKTKAESSKSAK